MSTINLGKSVIQASNQKEEIGMGQREDLISHVFVWENFVWGRVDNMKSCT
jgi:hypothetical protein